MKIALCPCPTQEESLQRSRYPVARSRLDFAAGSVTGRREVEYRGWQSLSRFPQGLRHCYPN